MADRKNFFLSLPLSRSLSQTHRSTHALTSSTNGSNAQLSKRLTFQHRYENATLSRIAFPKEAYIFVRLENLLNMDSELRRRPHGWNSVTASSYKFTVTENKCPIRLFVVRISYIHAQLRFWHSPFDCDHTKIPDNTRGQKGVAVFTSILEL